MSSVSRPNWREHGIKIVASAQLDLNTPQTPGMTRAAAITHARAGAATPIAPVELLLGENLLKLFSLVAVFPDAEIIHRDKLNLVGVGERRVDPSAVYKLAHLLTETWEAVPHRSVASSLHIGRIEAVNQIPNA